MHSGYLYRITTLEKKDNSTTHRPLLLLFHSRGESIMTDRQGCSAYWLAGFKIPYDCIHYVLKAIFSGCKISTDSILNPDEVSIHLLFTNYKYSFIFEPHYSCILISILSCCFSNRFQYLTSSFIRLTC